MARKTKEDSQRTRNDILNAAERIFFDKGVATTTMADIADSAGVSRGAVYGHYKNKTDVCLAVCDRGLALLGDPFPHPGGTLLEQLYDTGMHYLRLCSAPGSAQRVLDILFFKCEDSEENRELWRLRNFCDKRANSISARMLRKAVKNGELPRQLNIELANFYLHSLFYGIYQTLVWETSPHRNHWPYAEQSLRMGINALRVPL